MKKLQAFTKAVLFIGLSAGIIVNAHAYAAVNNEDGNTNDGTTAAVLASAPSLTSATLASGDCGSSSSDSVEWELTGDGILTISGNGNMKFYYTDPPWEEYRTNIKTVVIGTGITRIPGNDFDDCENLKAINVDSDNTKYCSVNGVLYNKKCTELERCPTGLEGSFNVPEGVKYIGEDAFSTCAKLQSITLPKSVTFPLLSSAMSSAFNGCTGLKAINVNSGNTTYASMGGVLYNKGCTELIRCPEGMEGSFQVPDGVTGIGYSAFHECKNISAVILPESLNTIGVNAFIYCTGLTEMEIPDRVTGIGEHAFYSCTGLKSITIPDSVTHLEEGAFQYCSGLESVTIPGGITSLEGRVFDNCTGLKSIVIPNNITVIGKWAFYDCSRLKAVTISDSVESIGAGAFYGCSALTEVMLPEGLVLIDEDTFSRCKSLKSIMIPESVTAIQSSAFFSCRSLIKITIPSCVMYIADDAFSGSDAVTLYVEAGSYAEQYAKKLDLFYTVYDKSSTYTVTYNANGGTGAPSPQTKESAAALTLSSVKPSKTYRIQYNANGGTVLPAGRTVACAFVKWNSDINGEGASYDPSGKYTANADVTLYAQWTDPAAGELATPVRTGYTFDGWYTDATEGVQISESSTVSGNMTVYAHWLEAAADTYTVKFNANGGTGAPSSQTKERSVALTLSSVKPSKTYVIRYNANGGSVSPASRSVSCTFLNWNSSEDGTGTSFASGGKYTANADVTLYAQWKDPAAGTLATPSRSGYTFFGWFTAAVGGNQINESSTITGTMTVYAHWSPSGSDPYNMGDETYSFKNFSDVDSPRGHCFGMAMTSAGYHNNYLDIADLGGNADASLYGFEITDDAVKQPICYYQKRQGNYLSKAYVAGGSYISSDWRKAVNYVCGHEYDDTGRLQIAFTKNGEGGHAVNFLRYENVDGQDRIYIYDNNFPTQETYLYRDSSGNVLQAPRQTFSGSIDSIALIDCKLYFENIPQFDETHAVYMSKKEASIQGYSYSEMFGSVSNESYVMYEIPENVDQVIIVPHKANADFIYMDREYSFGETTTGKGGVLKFATTELGAVTADAVFTIIDIDTEFGKPDFTLPSSLAEIKESAFENMNAAVIYVPDSCVSIGAYAFRYADVEQIRIPEGCSIADTAFDGCAAVQIFGKSGSPAETFCASHENCTFIEE